MKHLPYFANKDWTVPGSVQSMQEYLGLGNEDFAAFCGLDLRTVERLRWRPDEATRAKLDEAADRALQGRVK